MTIRLILLALIVSLPIAASAESRRIVLVGDSIMAGLLAGGQSALSIKTIEGWVKAELGPGFKVLDVAYPGTASLDWVPGQPAFRPRCLDLSPTTSFFDGCLVPKLPADLVVLMLGTNDSASSGRREPVSVSDYEGNLRRFVEGALDHGAKAVLLVTPPPVCRSKEARNEQLARYGSSIRRICSSTERVSCGPDVFTLLDAETHLYEGKSCRLDQRKWVFEPESLAYQGGVDGVRCREGCDVHPLPGGAKVIGLAIADAVRKHFEPAGPKKDAQRLE